MVCSLKSIIVSKCFSNVDWKINLSWLVILDMLGSGFLPSKAISIFAILSKNIPILRKSKKKTLKRGEFSTFILVTSLGVLKS